MRVQGINTHQNAIVASVPGDVEEKASFGLHEKTKSTCNSMGESGLHKEDTQEEEEEDGHVEGEVTVLTRS